MGRTRRWLRVGVAAPLLGVAAATAAVAALRAMASPRESAAAADQDRNASQWPGTQAEVSIAVDRLHPSSVLAASMSLPDGRILAMSSGDFGVTWSQAAVPLGEGSRIDNDPMVAFDTRGNAYLAKIPVGAPGTLGIEVTRSPDGGRTWEPPVRLSAAVNKDDKVALAVDDNLESQFRDRIYVAWKWPSGRVFFSRSLDAGATFSPPAMIEIAYVSGLDLAVGRDGAVFLAFHDNRLKSIRVMHSSDGGNSFTPSVKAADLRADWNVVPPAQCVRLALVHASVTVDRSDSPRRGNVYVAWSDYPLGVTDSLCPNACDSASPCAPLVYFASSENGGSSWTPPTVVAPETAGTGDRFHQWIRADPRDGAISVVYKDSRNDATRQGTDVYLAESLDGGVTWKPPMRLSSVTSRASGYIQYGDYQSVAVAEGNVYAAWADYRDDGVNGEIYARRVVSESSTTDRKPVVPVPGTRPTPSEIGPRP